MRPKIKDELEVKGKGSRRQVAMDDMIAEMSRNTNGTGQLIGDLAAVLEKYECHSPLLIQLLEHKYGCGRSVKNVRAIQLSIWEKEEEKGESEFVSE